MHFTISWSFYVRTSTKKKLVNEHWPQILDRLGPTTILREVMPRPGNRGPFHIFAITPLVASSEADAVWSCLKLALSFLGPWYVAEMARDKQGRLTSFLAGWKGPDNPGKGLAIVSAELLMFETNAAELLAGGISMTVA